MNLTRQGDRDLEQGRPRRETPSPLESPALRTRMNSQQSEQPSQGTPGADDYNTLNTNTTPSTDARASPTMQPNSLRSGSGVRSVFARSVSLVGETTPLKKMTQYFILPPEDSVYSYFMFIPPIEQRRTKRYITPLIAFAFTLVLVNFVMQSGLLVVVGRYIMAQHVLWVSTLVHLKQAAWYHIVPMPYNRPPPPCLDNRSSLCWERGDDLSCAPKSTEAMSRWDLLDMDGDGMWSRSEAKNPDLRAQFQCDYNVDIPLMYDTIVHSLNSSSILQGRRDTRLFSGEGVHKAYFNWFLHKPMLCQYGDFDMCGPLFQRGFFDEALLQQSSPAFKDVASALKYCHHVLAKECFEILPNTYRVWRSVSTQQCGEKLYGQSNFQSPVVADGDDESGGLIVPMLTVEYHKHLEYSRTKSYEFRLFLCILLITFLSVMAEEARSITKVICWTITFPKDTEAGHDDNIVGRRSVKIDYRVVSDDADEPPDSTRKDTEVLGQSILAVRSDHRAAVLIVTIFRALLWIFLLWSGIMFLTGRPRYLTLIFDALSLVFIFEIDELLYRTMLRVEFKNDHFSTYPMEVPQLHGGNIQGRHTVLFDILAFGAIICFAALVVLTYCTVELNPLIEALECLCKAEGGRCYEARQYSKSWWDTYWSTTLPAANMIIDQLKGT